MKEPSHKLATSDSLWKCIYGEECGFEMVWVNVMTVVVVKETE